MPSSNAHGRRPRLVASFPARGRRARSVGAEVNPPRREPRRVLKTTAGLLAALALVACGGHSTNTPAGPTSPSVPVEDANAILARCPTPAEVAASDRDLRLSFDYDVTAGRIVCTAAQSSRDLTLLQAQTYRVHHNNAASHVRCDTAVDVQFPVYVDGLLDPGHPVSRR